MVCHFEYEPAERGSPCEPAIDQVLILSSAYVEGVDIAHLLLESIAIEISNLAQLELENQECES